MKYLITILAAAALSFTAFAQNANDTGKLPTQGTQIGGKGADGLFHFMNVDASGNMVVSGGTSASAAGAANFVTGQVTAGSAGTLVIARATRRFVTVKNTDAAITVYVGPATVTSGNGMPVKAGESINLPWVGLIQVLAASGSPVVAYADFYD